MAGTYNLKVKASYSDFLSVEDSVLIDVVISIDCEASATVSTTQIERQMYQVRDPKLEFKIEFTSFPLVCNQEVVI